MRDSGIHATAHVWTMLFGSVLSVIGMIYAFYVKPALKRRAAMRVYAKSEGAT